MNESNKYWAFISYSHKDKAWGDWLHKSLEQYKVPRKLVGQMGRDGPIPKRVFPVFRDREELPTSADLGSNIEVALKQSRFLIVICSPNSANSIWVNEEIKTFKSFGKADHVLCLIVDGEPNATDQGSRSQEECFPEAVRFEVSSQRELTETRAEPIAADLRPQGDGRDNAKLKLLAGLLGVNFDDLKQRDKKRRQKQRALFGLGTLLFSAAIATAAFMFEQQNLKREFEQTNFALGVAQSEIDKGHKSIGALLAQHAVSKADDLSLGKISSWVEQFLEVPLSGRADSKRLLVVASQTLLTQSFSAHPRQAWWQTEKAGVSSVSFGQTSGVILVKTLDGASKVVSAENGSRISVENEQPIQITQAKRQSSTTMTDLDIDQLLTELNLSKEEISHTAFSPSTAKVAIATSQNLVTIADLMGKQRQDIQLPRESGKIIGLLFGNNGRHLLARFEQADFWLYNVQEQNALGLTGVDAVALAAFRPNSSELAVNSEDQITIFDLKTSSAHSKIKIAESITGMQFVENGRSLLISSANGYGMVLISTDSEQRRLKTSADSLKYLSFSNDGRWLASVDDSREPRIRIWDVETGEQQQQIEIGSGGAKSISFSADNQWLILPTAKSIKAWQFATGELNHNFSPLSGNLSGYALNPNSRSLILWTNENDLELWSLETGGIISTFQGHTAQVTSASFSQDGKQLVSVAEDGSIRVWSVPGGEQTWTKNHVATHAVDAEFNYAGTKVATRATDKSAYIWDLNSGEAKQLSGHDHEFGKAQFSPDDTLLLTTDYPDFSSSTRKLSVRIWDPDSGQLIRVLADHWNFGAPSAQFLLPENRVITRSDAVRIFAPRSGELISSFDSRNFAVDKRGERIAVEQGDQYLILPILPKSGSLDSAINEVIPMRLTDWDLQRFFPETPPLFGY